MALWATALTLALALQLRTLGTMLVIPLQLLFNHPLCCTHQNPTMSVARFGLSAHFWAIGE